MKPLSIAIAFLLVVSNTVAQEANCDETNVPKYALPDPLLATDRSPIISAEQWQSSRREEVLDLFKRHVYGAMPLAMEIAHLDRHSLIETDCSAVHVVAAADNDLFGYISGQRANCVRHDRAAALPWDQIAKGDAVLLLADRYPQHKTVVPDGFYKQAADQGVKVFVEFPDRLTEEATGEIKGTRKERAVIVDPEFFGEALAENSILDAGVFSYVTVADRKAYLRGAKVAGFEIAPYGLTGTASVPLLFEDHGVLVCTTKISDFSKSRYSPHDSWGVALGGILSQMSIVPEKKVVKWVAPVRPSYERTAELPNDAYQKSVQRGADWYTKGRFLIHPDWQEHWNRHNGLKVPAGAPMDLSLASGDGSLGVMEGHFSFIYPDGSQEYRYWLRADCVAETAMTLALANESHPDKEKVKVATNLLRFLFDTDTFKIPSSKDPAKTSYGLMGWAKTHKYIYYGDDNARVLLGSIMASHLLDEHQWDRDIVRLILGNFRTTGSKGFRKANLISGDIDRTTWRALSNRNLIAPHPHMESWLWATYLWLHDKTDRPELLAKAKVGIAETMTRYPDGWKWTNGIQQERARMILPLAWLVRVEDTPQHRKWLNFMVSELLEHQVACGAIREEVGKSGGSYGPTKSNRAYGTNEAPVIFANGDLVADMLYTSNFAFFALNEAAHATGDPAHAEAVKKLADFLVRIQSVSDERGDLDGCWFRAFDFDRWEFYGSNADHGWGAWGTLTGWTQSFITSTLALRLTDDSYWARTSDSTIAVDFDAIWKEMLPPPAGVELSHAATGKTATLLHPADERYPGLGVAGLTDGKGSPKTAHTSPHWLGFEGKDFEATIDMGAATEIDSVATRFLFNERLGILFPSRVTLTVSDDGETFKALATVDPVQPDSGTPTHTDTVGFNKLKTTARYVRISASKAAANRWIFSDEIMINPGK